MSDSDVLLGPPEVAAKTAVDEEWFHDEESTRALGFGKGLSGSMKAAEFLADSIRDHGDNTEVYGIYSNGRAVGLVWASKYADEMRCLRLSPFVEKSSRGKGVFTSMISRVLDGAFSNGIYRVELEPLRINKPIISALRKIGFKQEGIKRSAFWMDNNDYDTVLLRMLRREWAKIKKQSEGEEDASDS